MDGINVGRLTADLEVVDKTDDGLKRAKANLQRMREALEDAEEGYRRASAEAAAHAARVESAAKAYQHFVSVSAGASGVAESVGNLNNRLGRGKSDSNSFAQGMMQVGYVLDDLQYSFLATVNNIGPMVAAFGVGAGLAGALQITAVAGAQLYQNWDNVKAALGDTSGIERARNSIAGMKAEVESLASEIDTATDFKLFGGGNVTAGAVTQLRADRDKLGALRDREAAVKDMQGTGTEGDRKSAERFRKIVAQYDDGKGPGGIEGLARSIGDRALKDRGIAEFLKPDDAENFRKAEELFKNEQDPGVRNLYKLGIDRFREQARKNAEDQARTAIADASLTEEGRKRLGGGLSTSRNAGERKLGRTLLGRELTPEEQAKAEKEAADKSGADRKAEDDRNRDFRKANRELAGLVMPGLSTAARQAQDAIDAGGSADDEQASLAARLQRAGMTGPDAALAAKDALAEQAKVDPEQRRKRREQEAEQARREKERGAREAIGRAEERIPGLKDRVEETVAAATAGGYRLSDVKVQIARALMASGSANGEGEAMAAADQLATEGRKSVAEKVRESAMQTREAAFSQTMAASDLARTAQAGVKSDETPKKLDRVIEQLGQLVKNGQNVLNVRIN